MARPRSSGRRTDYAWQGTTGAISAFAATQAIGPGSVASNASATVMRVRGHINVGMDVGAADNKGVVAVGLIIGTDDAVAVGATAFPSPADDIDADWFWHGWFSLQSITGTQTDAEGGQFQAREIDSKAMRRIRQNEQVVLMADASIEAGSPTFDLVYGLRVLFGS